MVEKEKRQLVIVDNRIHAPVLRIADPKEIMPFLRRSDRVQARRVVEYLQSNGLETFLGGSVLTLPMAGNFSRKYLDIDLLGVGTQSNIDSLSHILTQHVNAESTPLDYNQMSFAITNNSQPCYMNVNSSRRFEAIPMSSNTTVAFDITLITKEKLEREMEKYSTIRKI